MPEHAKTWSPQSQQPTNKSKSLFRAPCPNQAVRPHCRISCSRLTASFGNQTFLKQPSDPPWTASCCCSRTRAKPFDNICVLGEMAQVLPWRDGKSEFSSSELTIWATQFVGEKQNTSMHISWFSWSGMKSRHVQLPGRVCALS